MKLPPYTYNEAKQLSGENQQLIGLSYDRSGNSIIDMVVVTPYDQNSKNRFIMLYLMLNDADAALSLDYAGTQYDVLVISGSASGNGMQQSSLYAWHTANTRKEMIMDDCAADVQAIAI